MSHRRRLSVFGTGPFIEATHTYQRIVIAETAGLVLRARRKCSRLTSSACDEEASRRPKARDPLRFASFCGRSDVIAADAYLLAEWNHRIITNKEEVSMAESQRSQREPRSMKRRTTSAAAWTVAFVAMVVFGVVLLAEGDWVPGAIIVAAALTGLAAVIPVIGKLCREAPAPSSPRSKPAS